VSLLSLLLCLLLEQLRPLGPGPWPLRAFGQFADVAARNLAVWEQQAEDTLIRAPFAGIVTSKNAQPGEMISPMSSGGFTRTGICTIVDMRSLEIEVDVNESYINRVTANQPVSAVLDAYPDWQIPAHVIAVVPTADRQKATVLVRIGFQQLDPRLLPDMGVKVTFLREADAAPAQAAQAVTLVPRAAITTDGATSVVFVVRQNTVERRAIKTAGTDGDRVEVVAGLKGGEQVVIAPPGGLAEGTLIEVKK